MSHPMAFQKASAVVATKGGRRDLPDVEDAIENSDDEAIVEESVEGEEDDEDISSDKMIKAKAVKANGKRSNSKKAVPKKAKI